LFDRVVAENGAVVFDPGTRHQRVIAEKPPFALVSALKDQKVEPLSVGESIVATWSPHEQTVLKTIRDLGHGHQLCVLILRARHTNVTHANMPKGALD
jgi:hypothetical protein